LSSIRYLSENFDQIADLVDHAANRRCVFQFADAVELSQAQTTNGVAVVLFATDGAANQLDLDGLLCCHRVTFRVQAKMSSTLLPRLAAISYAVVQCDNASKVARTML